MIGIGVLSVVLLWIIILNFVKVRTPQQQPGNALGAGVQSRLSFGPVIERTLSIDGEQFGFIDLDTGNIFRYRAGSAEEATWSKPTEFSDWVAEQGADLGFVTNLAGKIELAGFDFGYFQFLNEPIPAELSAAQGIYHGVTNVWDDVRADQLWKELSGILRRAVGTSTADCS